MRGPRFPGLPPARAGQTGAGAELRHLPTRLFFRRASGSMRGGGRDPADSVVGRHGGKRTPGQGHGEGAAAPKRFAEDAGLARATGRDSARERILRRRAMRFFEARVTEKESALFRKDGSRQGVGFAGGALWETHAGGRGTAKWRQLLESGREHNFPRRRAGIRRLRLLREGGVAGKAEEMICAGKPRVC